MKYLVISDNHGDEAILQAVAKKFEEQVDLMLHCGDSCLAKEKIANMGYHSVLGNCDYADYPEKSLINTATDKILLTHGHLYEVGFGLNKLSLAAKEEQANLTFFGHTHCLGCEYQAGCLYLNPGSISYPRGQYQKLGGTFAIVETTSSHIKVQYYDRSLALIPNLTWEFKR